MKKIATAITIALITINLGFGFAPNYDKDTKYLENVAEWVEEDKTFTDYESLYLRVSKDPELNKIEDWEKSLAIIWTYAEKTECSELSYSTVRQLLLNPTELDF